MAHKEFAFGEEARKKIVNGVNIVCNSVRTTLGPRGRNVCIQGPNGSVKISKDGVSVSKSVFLKDNFEDMGAQMVKQCAVNQVNDASDGTTSTIVLAQHMINEGVRLVAAGHNPIDIKRGMDLACKKVVEELDKRSTPVSTEQDIINIATISSNGDAEIGNLLSKAVNEVGHQGIIHLEEGHGINHELKSVSGYQFDRGYLSQYFANNDKLECVLENPLVLVCGNSITNATNVMIPIMESIYKTFPSRSLLLIAENIDGEALPVLVINNL